MLQQLNATIAEKREHQTPAKDDVLHKRSRLQPSCKPGEELYFFCDEEGDADGLHEVTTPQVDQRVQKCAELTGDRTDNCMITDNGF